MIYFISPKVKYSGNLSTISRISNYFKKSKIISVEEIRIIKSNDIIFGLHAYKVGRYLIDKNYNFNIIIGGTDLNCNFYDKGKKKILIKVFNQAKNIIVFNLYQQKILKNINFKSIIIPQAVGNLKTNNFNLRKFFNLKKDSIIFLIVGNLRDVKDPFYLIEKFKFLFDNYKYNFIYIGKNLESYNMNYYWIKHIDGLDQISTYTAINQSDGLINCSKSEGMAITILEAMKLKCPVFARINNSNEYIIKHKENGYLFKSPDDFINIITLDNEIIINNAYQYVNKYHSLFDEKNRYVKIFKKLIIA